MFMGDCITGLEDDYFQRWVAGDATMLAQLVENGKEISEERFANIVEPSYKSIQQPMSNYTYYYNFNNEIAWFYDENKDVEYFYA